jgi:hypothetical protein
MFLLPWALLWASPEGLAAQATTPSSGNGESPRSWLSIGGGGQFHLSGDQANPLRASGETQPAASLSPGLRLDAEAGRTVRGARVSLHGSWSEHNHSDRPGGFVVTGQTTVARAFVTLGLGEPTRRFGGDVGAGMMYLRSENVLSPAGAVIGLQSVAVGTLVTEWAPAAMVGLRVRVAGSDAGRSLILRAGLDIAATEERLSVLTPLGLQVRFAR